MNTRRVLLAVGVVASPVLMALGTALEPPISEKGAAAYAAIAADSGRYYWGVLIVMAGIGLLPVVGAAIATLVPKRGAAAATWAAALFGVTGTALAVGKGFQVMLWAMARPELASDRESFGHLGSQLPLGTEIFFIVATLGFLSAIGFGTIALWRSRAVPRRLAVMFGVTEFVAVFFSSTPGLGAALAVVPLVVVSGFLAAAVLRAARGPADISAQPAPASAGV